MSTSCSTGSYNPSTGQAPSNASCTACSSAPGSAVCSACPAGRYCTGLGRTDIGIACSPGTYSQYPVASDSATCVACPPGSFGPYNGTIAPFPFSPAGGTFSALPSLSTQNGCVNTACQDGYFCPPGAGSPTACPASSFSKVSNASSISQSEICRPEPFSTPRRRAGKSNSTGEEIVGPRKEPKNALQPVNRAIDVCLCDVAPDNEVDARHWIFELEESCFRGVFKANSENCYTKVDDETIRIVRDGKENAWKLQTMDDNEALLAVDERLGFKHRLSCEKFLQFVQWISKCKTWEDCERLFEAKYANIDTIS